MKRSLLLVLSLMLFFSCKNDKTENSLILSDSSGNINQLTIVIDNNLWEGEIGETIRDLMAAPVDGLPQEEPLFSLNQIPVNTFTGFVRNSRIFLKIEQADEPGIKFIKDEFAKPQTGIIVSGKDSKEIIDILNNNSEKIIKAYKRTELREKQRRIGKSLKKDKVLQERLGINLKFPTAYRYAIENDDFIWIRKEIPKGNMEILVYEVPLQTLDKDSSVVSNIIKMRDSVGMAQIPGPVKGSYMVTEDAYAPYLFETEIDGKFAYETRGTWEVKNAFMGGPFVNYAIRDSKNNRYIILEGFVFSPSTGKRDNVFELDAILQSAKFE